MAKSYKYERAVNDHMRSIRLESAKPRILDVINSIGAGVDSECPVDSVQPQKKEAASIVQTHNGSDVRQNTASASTEQGTEKSSTR